MRVVAAPDKLRGTASAAAVAGAIARAAAVAGWACDEVPLADGGEGTLEALGGANRTSQVIGPLGDLVDARWRLDGRTAVIEVAEAAGLVLVGGAHSNDPIAASTAGVGQLLVAALDVGATRVVVGVGGTASTDGGLAALRALHPLGRLKGIELIVGCDVRTPFIDAADVFGPQKGATPAQVKLLRRRLGRLAQVYLAEHGIDVTTIEGAGAGGGLAGGLAAAGARLVGGFDLVADEVELYDHLEGADLVITAEGFLDEQSFDGKVVGGVAGLAALAGVPVVAIVGEVFDGVDDRIEVVSIVDRFGEERAVEDTLGCIEAITTELLAARASS